VPVLFAVIHGRFTTPKAAGAGSAAHGAGAA